VFDADPFDDVSLELLKRRRSAKWATHPPDVLPAWVAETDFALALPIRETLLEAVSRDDTGYLEASRLGASFASFAAARFGWEVDPARVLLVPDVMSAVAELLRLLLADGEAYVITPPVYPPFFSVAAEVGRRVVEAPLHGTGEGWRLDLEALESAFADGARAFLLCNPHNPTGRSYTREELDAVSAIAAEYGATVISDEVHGPMTMPGARHVPYVSLGEEAAAHGVVISSASKAFNVAGLKCAVIVSGSDEMHERLVSGLPKHLPYHTGHFGVLAALAAFEHGGEWLDALVTHLDRNRRALTELLGEHLPQVGYAEPQAGYLAWLDCRELGLGDDPAEAFLERGRVALSPGPTFGEPGRGFARLNIGTSRALVEEAVLRMTSAL
jgi:cysteine-S-conjugate beta-lyase